MSIKVIDCKNASILSLQAAVKKIAELISQESKLKCAQIHLHPDGLDSYKW